MRKEERGVGHKGVKDIREQKGDEIGDRKAGRNTDVTLAG